MKTPNSTTGDWRQWARTIWVAWLYSLLFPLLVLLLWQSPYGMTIALCAFFASGAGLTAHAFCHCFQPALQMSGAWQPGQLWCRQMSFLVAAQLARWVVFAALCLTVGAHDFVACALAFGSLIPALAVTPYVALATRKIFTPVVFTIFLTLGMKLLGCIVVVLIYGWNADARGYTILSWTHPNLLVWLFWLNTALLSWSFYILGRNKFIRNLTTPFVASAISLLP